MKDYQNGNWYRLWELATKGDRAFSGKIKLRDKKRNKKKIIKTLALKRD